MDILSKVGPDEWEMKAVEFDQWCQAAIEDIDNISRETSQGMAERLRKRIHMVEQRAIGAAEEAEEDG